FSTLKIKSRTLDVLGKCPTSELPTFRFLHKTFLIHIQSSTLTVVKKIVGQTIRDDYKKKNTGELLKTTNRNVITDLLSVTTVPITKTCKAEFSETLPTMSVGSLLHAEEYRLRGVNRCRRRTFAERKPSIFSDFSLRKVNNKERERNRLTAVVRWLSQEYQRFQQGQVGKMRATKERQKALAPAAGWQEGTEKVHSSVREDNQVHARPRPADCPVSPNPAPGSKPG
ncbi:mCG146014, partial [Mus musculus]